MSVLHLTENTFENEVINSYKPVRIDFWASWCMPCRMLSPTIEELGQEVSDVKIAKINVDEEEQLARMFRVNSIPTLVMVKDGKVVSRSVGVQTKDRILAMIEENK